MTSSAFSRRSFIAMLPLTLAACAGSLAPIRQFDQSRGPYSDSFYLSMYGPLSSEVFPIPPLDLNKIDSALLRREVAYVTDEEVGTLIINPHEKYLYLVRPQGRAIRYGIGVGREGFGWSGRAMIRRKAAWPRWTPTASMVARDEKAARWVQGMPGGLGNPLGARALYLYRGGRDTLYRIHGTNEPWSIGHNVSSGCIRLFNHDIIDLYERVPLGTAVVVRSADVLAEPAYTFTP